MLTDSLTKRLEALKYDEQVIKRVDYLRTLPDSSDVRLIDVRICLEKFLQDTARLSARYGGPKFVGDFSSPRVVRAFLEAGCWITRQELEFITSFYGLMSDSAAHGGKSMLDPLAAKYMCWSVVNTISHRVLDRPTSFGSTRERDKIEQFLANEFVEALRAGKSEGRAFEPTFTESTMKKVRQRLTVNDTDQLWTLMTTASADPELRNRAASLLLGERLFEHPTEQGRVADEMRRYYEDNKSVAPWQLLRAISLALSNQTGDAECLREYLSVIENDTELLELNLQVSDTYYQSPENATSIFLKRVGAYYEFSTAKCIWEVFYLSRRVKSDKEKAIRTIEKRANNTGDAVLRQFCSDCVAHLKRSR
jgi:hypothetical protein